MCSLFKIYYEFRHPEIWRMVFLSASLFGIYLAGIILISSRIKKQHSLFLGFFIAALAIVLLEMTMLIHPMKQLKALIAIPGMASLFLIGPFSYHVHMKQAFKSKGMLLMVQFIPALIAGILSWKSFVSSTWILMAGLVHVGLYLVIRHFLHTRIHEAWNSQLNRTQLALYTLVLLAAICCPAPLCYYITAICLMALIVLIWIRLLKTSVANYIK